MADTDAQAGNAPPVADSQNKQTAQPASDATLNEILDTMQDSDIFQRTGKDAPSRFWSAYERVAKQHDDELLERHNGDLDVLLIFAGLFSAVSSAFIVSMGPNLIPNPNETTNSLLKILINKIDNSTFPPDEAAIPVWTGPSSTTIWIQTLGYTSLSASLLAAFGAVLGKQWLGHFKTSRFGKGALHERCQRRQQKLNGLEAWHLSTIIATLPILLQLSLLFFGIALAANIWTQQQTVASVIMAATAFGSIFYFFTVVASLKSPDCPFQTPVSTLIQRVMISVLAVMYTITFQKVVRQKWQRRPRSWVGFLDGLRLSSMRIIYAVKDLISDSIARLAMYLSQLLKALRRNVGLFAHGPEAAAGSELSSVAERVRSAVVAAGERKISLEVLDLGPLESRAEAQVNAVQSSAIHWILETTTDTDIISTAARMILEIEWPAEDDVTDVLDRLKSHFYACFDPTRQMLPLAQARAVACLKARYHFCVERDLRNPFHIYSDGDIVSNDDDSTYHMPPDHDFRVIRCAAGYPIELDIASLQLSDRMWMAHVFTYRLQQGSSNPEVVTFVIDFIGICLNSESPSRLVADCLLLAGLLIGLRIDRRQLAWLDKSKAIPTLRDLVVQPLLDMLAGAGDIPKTALKLVQPLLQDFDTSHTHFKDPRTCKRSLKFCFRLLEGHAGTEREDQVRFRTVAILIRIINRHAFWVPHGWYTPPEFDLLVDYLVQIRDNGTDHDAIGTTFEVLQWLGGSPSTQDVARRYIDTTIRFMDQATTRHVALEAACKVRTAVASIGRDDESFQEHFLKALASAVLGHGPAMGQASIDGNTFKNIEFFRWHWVLPYLGLLCTLSQEPTWQSQLHQSGHFDNCLAIADALSSQKDEFLDGYALPVAYIFALIDASGEKHPFYHAVQSYPIWPLVLRAWRVTFHFRFFKEATEKHWVELSGAGHIDTLPFLTAYARKRCNHSNESLITLVEQVCQKLDEEQRAREQGNAQHIHKDPSFGHGGIPALGRQIREQIRGLLDSWREM